MTRHEDPTLEAIKAEQMARAKVDVVLQRWLTAFNDWTTDRTAADDELYHAGIAWRNATRNRITTQQEAS